VPDKSVVGLEIVEQCIRAVEIRKPDSKSPTVVAHAEVDLPEGAARESEVFDPDAVALALQRLWDKGGFSTRSVRLGIGNRRVLVRDHVAPLLPLEQIKQALPFQVQDLLPVPVEQAVLDFYPIRPVDGPDGPGVEGLLVAGVSDMIENLISTLRRAKLTVEDVDLAPFGLCRAVSNAIDPAQTALVVHIGANVSYIVVVAAGVPQLVRILPGGVQMRPWEREVDETVGRRRRIETGVSRLGALASRVRDTCDYYVSRNPGHTLQTIRVCGEGAAHPDAVETLQSVLELPVAPVRLPEVVSVKAKAPLTEVSELGLITLVGIALGGTK